MFMIKKVTRVEFPKDVIHKPLRPNPVKNPIVPSPEREPDITADEGAEAGVDWQQCQQQPTAQVDRPVPLTGLTSGGLDSTVSGRNPPPRSVAF
jgi:hypothetical protein